MGDGVDLDVDGWWVQKIDAFCFVETRRSKLRVIAGSDG